MFVLFVGKNVNLMLLLLTAFTVLMMSWSCDSQVTYLQVSDDVVLHVFFLLLQEMEADRVE